MLGNVRNPVDLVRNKTSVERMLALLIRSQLGGVDVKGRVRSLVLNISFH